MMSENEKNICIAAQAYQIIWALAGTCGLFWHPEVTRALDYFGDIANGEPGKRTSGEILPWGDGIKDYFDAKAKG